MEKGSEQVASSRPVIRWWLTVDGGVRVWVDPMTEEAFIGSKHKGKSWEIILESSTKEDELKNYDEKLLSTPKTNSLSSEVLPLGPEKAPESNCRDMEAYCSARSRLLDICIANNWSIPSYGLLEKGSSEEKIFTARVTVEVEFISSTLLECFSEPKAQKEEAQEQAAEGALWYLGHLEYFKP